MADDSQTLVVDKFIFNSHVTLEQVRDKQDKFASERNWEQYHTPRNLLLAMVGEVGELSELFQWRGEVQEGLPGWTEEVKVHLGEELSDVLIYLVRLSERCHVNLPAAVMRKFELYSQQQTPLSVSDSRMKSAAKKDKKGVTDLATQASDKFTFSSDLSLEEIRTKQEIFQGVLEQTSGHVHTPRNLLLALVTNVGELSEMFQWRGEVKEGLAGWTEEDKVHLGEKLSDILIHLIRLSERCHVNLPAAVMRKFELNARKYPANRVYGSSLKYTAYASTSEETNTVTLCDRES